ncbi:MAG: hypothetical protein AAF752_08370 [Bacteroidota bacterium]
MNRLYPSLLFAALVLSAGCAEPQAPSEAPATPAESASFVPQDRIDARVAAAHERLEATEGGRLLREAIDAHGGLATWYANGPIAFTYRYGRGNGSALETAQVIDTWSSRARHEVLNRPDSLGEATFGWTGQEAWAMPNAGAVPTNARFWALTPYYFVSMPFVLADPGVNLEAAGQMSVEDRTYDLVYATFDSGTGDAPDDYYYVLIDPETKQVGGVRYIVSYPGFYEKGQHSTERLMLYDGAQTIDGITVQEGFRSFAWTGAGKGEAAATGTTTNVRFESALPSDYFDMPAEAETVEM